MGGTDAEAMGGARRRCGCGGNMGRQHGAATVAEPYTGSPPPRTTPAQGGPQLVGLLHCDVGAHLAAATAQQRGGSKRRVARRRRGGCAAPAPLPQRPHPRTLGTRPPLPQSRAPRAAALRRTRPFPGRVGWRAAGCGRTRAYNGAATTPERAGGFAPRFSARVQARHAAEQGVGRCFLTWRGARARACSRVSNERRCECTLARLQYCTAGHSGCRTARRKEGGGGAQAIAAAGWATAGASPCTALFSLEMCESACSADGVGHQGGLKGVRASESTEVGGQGRRRGAAAAGTPAAGAACLARASAPWRRGPAPRPLPPSSRAVPRRAARPAR